MKNITLSVPDDVYRSARLEAAKRETSVSALVSDYLTRLSGVDRFAELEQLQAEVLSEIGSFSGSDRLGRDDVHDRALR